MEKVFWSVQIRLASNWVWGLRKRKAPRITKTWERWPLPWKASSKLVISWLVMPSINLSTFSSTCLCWKRVQCFLIWKVGAIFNRVALKSLPHPSSALFSVTLQGLGEGSAVALLSKPCPSLLCYMASG